MQAAERNDTIEDYKKQLARQFNIWFPPSAWGAGRFNISYNNGQFNIRVLRRISGGCVTDNVSFTFSDWFTQFYKQTAELFRDSGTDEELERESNLQVNRALDRIWRLRDITTRKYATELDGIHIGQQTFIPAGRAFFTSIGRLVAGFEQTGSFDPITIKFAKLFANLRDRNARRYVSRFSRLEPAFLEKRSKFMTQLFGGELVFEDDTEFVEAEDGRRIPFNSLSSGQQELLPMWSLIDYFSEMDVFRRETRVRSSAQRSTDLIYIEEPEAHLFPTAQSQLMEFLIGSISSERNQRYLIMTTHSPYIMSQLNVFLKAGQLSKRKKKNQEINEIVPRECWLSDYQLSALAIEGRQIRNLLDEDGLIDGRYLDKISEDIATKFGKLLEIEMEI